MFEHIDTKDSFLNSTGWFNYVVVMTISLWGGFVSYFSKKEKFDWVNFIAHQSSASFAGLMAFFACEHANITGPLVGVVIGVAAHTGTPALVKLLMKLKNVQKVIGEEATK